MTRYNIQKVLFSNGERFPMLVESKTNIPHYWITIYSMTQLRSRGLAVNTIEQTLRHLMLLMFFLKNNYNEEVNLDSRLAVGKILELHEIETLCDICKLHYKDIFKENNLGLSESNLNLRSLEKFRAANSSDTILTTDSKTTSHRIRAIRDYIIWLSKNFLSRNPDLGLNTLSLNDAIKLVESAFTSRIPKTTGISPINAKKGLSTNELNILFSLVDSNSVTNPWISNFTKIRNELIILWLYEFGLRRGELLNLKISDIDFQSETFLVLRRPDDENDPRSNQPLVKTKERKLAIPTNTLNLTREYIIGVRGLLPEAQYHEYLFVADKSGAPMSLSALNKMFIKLKDSNDNLPNNFSPHTLRHSWNDNFSAIMDKKNIPEDKEKKIRSYAMGWSDTSNAASSYTRRHREEEANKVILEMAGKTN
ncbi:tyrosine-type recombinase/integrase [Sulfurimonas sp.]|uniref:tyrosine-type recombinase/integrase n=1 Tax=Sulfurimonas sp. TaxID=2022749 RepID=UPI003567B715